MSPKQKMITTVWCAITMVSTMILSHGHLVMREIMTHWPTEDSWEGRIENALYTQGGLVFLASLVIGGVILVRSYFARVKEEELKRRELSQREKHERAAAKRHDALLDSLTRVAAGKDDSMDGNKSQNASHSRALSVKKSHASGGRPK